jgi:sulfate adenylyltransferase subunit 1 (EFTu-like GTPase family)
VDYSQERFLQLKEEFSALARSLGIELVVSIPISALEGDNVVDRSRNMPWYEGTTLLEHLETVEIVSAHRSEEFRFPVQSVIRPDATFRGFAGRVASGTIRPGDSVLALPSRQQSKVKEIVIYDGGLDVAIPQQSVVLRLEDEIDLSRGDLLVSPDAPPSISDRFSATVVWLHAQPLHVNQTYLVKHSGRLVKAKASRIHFRVNVNDSTEHPAEQLEMNEIALVEFVASTPLIFDRYQQNRAMGSFILIDPLSNATVGAAMIREELSAPADRVELVPSTGSETGRITSEERAGRHRHVSGLIVVQNGTSAAELLERELFARGFEAFFLRSEEFAASVTLAVLSALSSMGSLVIYEGDLPLDEITAIEAAFEGRVVPLNPAESSLDPGEIVRRGLNIAETLRFENNSEKGHTTDHD